MSTEAAHHSPLDQFAVSPVLSMPRALGVDTSLTNSGLAMLVAIAIAVANAVKTACPKDSSSGSGFRLPESG